MTEEIDALLAAPSRASWRALRHLWTALPPEDLRLDAWSAALAAWPDAWRVASPGWIPIASHPRAVALPAPDAWTTPLFRLARALDFYFGRALHSTERVIDALSRVDLRHITHLRHRERAPFLAPTERGLAQLIRSGAYDSVTHLMVEWPTDDEAAAIAGLPALRELCVAGWRLRDGPRLATADAIAAALAGSSTLEALDAKDEVWAARRATPLFARLKRAVGSVDAEPVGLASPEEVPMRRWAVSELVATAGIAPAYARSHAIQAPALAMLDAPPRAVPRDATQLTLRAQRKITPKVARAWAAEDLAALPLDVAAVDIGKDQPSPVRVRPRALVMHTPTPVTSVLAPGATVRALELRPRDTLSARLWTAAEVTAALDALDAPLEVFVLEGTTLTAEELASVLSHPRLRDLRALRVREAVPVREGRKYVKRPRSTLSLDAARAVAAMTSLRWLSLTGFEAASREVFAALRLPSLYALELDVTGARTLGDALSLLTRETETLALSGLETVVRDDELLHVPNHPHLERVQLWGLPRHDDDAESLDYAVGGVYVDRALASRDVWLDEPT